jgi:hypothetical protein
MGGDYEDTIEPGKGTGAAKAKGGAAVASPSMGGTEGEETMVQGLRFHLSRGQVHFHDDKAALKVAVPASAWWGAWQRLRVPAGAGNSAESFTYLDLDNSTLLRAKSELVGDAVKVVIGVERATLPASYDRVWHALETFTNKAQTGK